MMDNLKMHTPNLVDENYKKLSALFPNAVTETLDENGEVVRAIDADVLRQEISATVVEGPQERYQFTWPDKKKSVVIANQPIAKTLRLDREKSVGRDGTPGSIDTENIYIEGDNLDALKLLQETYLGKVKMIYIDPPYNTGSDEFLYDDDRSISGEEFSERSGQYDKNGNMLFDVRVNNEVNGRFHTDWLNMLYPRLRIAKDLLSDDGLIFISIDDCEQENIKKSCNEIFGSDSFVNMICVETSNGLFGLKAKFADSTIVKTKDYVLVYRKKPTDLNLNPLYTKSKKLFDTHFNYYKNGKFECQLNDFLKNNKLIAEKAEIMSLTPSVNNLHILMSTFKEVNNLIISEMNNIYRIREYTLNISDKDRELLSDGCKHIINGVYVFKDGLSFKYLYPFSKIVHKSDDYEQVECSCVIQGDLWKGFNDDMGNIGKEGGVKFENGKKPVRLIKNMLKLIKSEDCIVLDFFSGSATTAHAVMQLNTEDGGHRKFIMVQLPEICDEKSEAYKAGYKNICEIGEERIRRAGKKIKEDNKDKDGIDNLDIGFRVFRVDSSNMKDVYYTPAEYKQEQMELFADNIKEDRTPEDLLFQVMLDLGIMLSSDIEETKIAGKRVFSVAGGYLIACFDSEVTEETVTEIAKRHPFFAVFRDNGMANDSVMTNFEQIFETYSPRTQRKVL